MTQFNKNILFIYSICPILYSFIIIQTDKLYNKKSVGDYPTDLFQISNFVLRVIWELELVTIVIKAYCTHFFTVIA